MIIVCNKCEAEKPISEFHKDPTSRTGFRGKCKNCRNKTSQRRSRVLRKDGKKTCSCCREEKRLSKFHKSSATKDRRQYMCKTCTSKRDRRVGLQKKYGITLKEYDQLFQQQNGMCAICGTDKPSGRWNRFCVDHDHITGRVRALLCNGCNQGIGYLNDDPELLEKAAEYIRTFREIE